MNDDEDNSILGTSTLRGILLLGGVGFVAFLAYKFWKSSASAPAPKAQTIRVPIELPIHPTPVAKK